MQATRACTRDTQVESLKERKADPVARTTDRFALAIVSLAYLETRWTAIGAMLWLGARVVYLPLYALGVPMVRTSTSPGRAQ